MMNRFQTLLSISACATTPWAFAGAAALSLLFLWSITVMLPALLAGYSPTVGFGFRVRVEGKGFRA
jgi:hypothetical protein